MTKKPSAGDEQLAHAIAAVANLNDTLGQLTHGIKTIQAVQRQGADRRALAAGRLSASSGRLLGATVRETSGAAAATVRLLDGRDASAQVIAVIVLAQGASGSLSLPSAGVAFVHGLYADISGAVEGAAYLGPTT